MFSFYSKWSLLGASYLWKHFSRLECHFMHLSHTYTVTELDTYCDCKFPSCARPSIGIVLNTKLDMVACSVSVNEWFYINFRLRHSIRPLYRGKLFEFFFIILAQKCHLQQSISRITCLTKPSVWQNYHYPIIEMCFHSSCAVFSEESDTDKGFPLCEAHGSVSGITIQWRHNRRDGVWNHQSRHCLLNRLYRCRSKKTSKLRVTGLCAGNLPVTGEFPAQMASNAENVSIWWRHHE